MLEARIVRASVVAGVGPFMWVFNARVQQALKAAICNFGVPKCREHRNTAADRGHRTGTSLLTSNDAFSRDPCTCAARGARGAPVAEASG